MTCGRWALLLIAAAGATVYAWRHWHGPRRVRLVSSVAAVVAAIGFGITFLGPSGPGNEADGVDTPSVGALPGTTATSLPPTPESPAPAPSATTTQRWVFWLNRGQTVRVWNRPDKPTTATITKTEGGAWAHPSIFIHGLLTGGSDLVLRNGPHGGESSIVDGGACGTA